jgi:hypothetical protein
MSEKFSCFDWPVLLKSLPFFTYPLFGKTLAAFKLLSESSGLRLKQDSV